MTIREVQGKHNMCKRDVSFEIERAEPISFQASERTFAAQGEGEPCQTPRAFGEREEINRASRAERIYFVSRLGDEKVIQHAYAGFGKKQVRKGHGNLLVSFLKEGRNKTSVVGLVIWKCAEKRTAKRHGSSFLSFSERSI